MAQLLLRDGYNAVEDPTAASGFFVGGNWVVRGDNNVVNGALRLEMR